MPRKSPCMVQRKTVQGDPFPVWRCKNTGYEAGSPECPNVMITGECKPRKKEYFVKRRKYRKTGADQITLGGENLRDLLWGRKR